MEVYVNGTTINLGQQNFVAKGGEGSIFHKNNIAYKIYEHLTKMIPPAKIAELQIPDPNVIGPRDLVINKKKQNIGFTMEWLGDDNIALCKLFTSKFQKDNNIINDQIIELIQNIKKTTETIHAHKCLIVDGNELNYLVKPNFVTPLFIDVNAWKTASYPPTAIMPSIRDWTSDEFNEITDWFSFAIVAFQLLIGIHPFKGKHKSYRKNDFINRVKDRVSVFNSGVSLPPTTRDFNLIPSRYKDWFYKIFENGDREPPPQLPGEIGKMQVIVKLVKSTGAFEIISIQEFNEEVLFHNPDYQITKTLDKIYLGKADYKTSKDIEIVITTLEKLPILIKKENGVAKFKCLKTGYVIKGAELACTDTIIINNTLYLKNREKLIEMTFKVAGNNILPVVKTVWTVEPLSSHIFSNVIYQSILGKAFLCIPLPFDDKKSQFHIKAIPELDNYRVIEARYQNQICVVIGHNGNEYNRLTFIFNSNFSTYRCHIVKGIDYAPLNFAVLDNGVCIMITEDNGIEIFLNRIDKPDVKRIEDPDIDGSMRLFKDGNRIKFFKDKSIYSMKMK